MLSAMTARLFQPLFLTLVAASLLLWVMAALVLRHAGLEVAIVAAFVFAIVAATTLLVFAIWRFGSGSEKTLFYGSYVASWLLPLLWAVVKDGFLLSYAVVVTKCCENSWFLHVTLWYALYTLPEHLFLAVGYGLLIYVSVWLAMRLENSKLVLASKVVAAVSALLFGLTVVFVAGDLP